MDKNMWLVDITNLCTNKYQLYLRRTKMFKWTKQQNQSNIKLSGIIEK